MKWVCREIHRKTQKMAKSTLNTNNSQVSKAANFLTTVKTSSLDQVNSCTTTPIWYRSTNRRSWQKTITKDSKRRRYRSFRIKFKIRNYSWIWWFMICGTRQNRYIRDSNRQKTWWISKLIRSLMTQIKSCSSTTHPCMREKHTAKQARSRNKSPTLTTQITTSILISTRRRGSIIKLYARSNPTTNQEYRYKTSKCKYQTMN